MNKRYLAFIALLAGWLCFCYWWYVKGIVPRFHEIREKSRSEDLSQSPFPIAFSWASNEPLKGIALDSLKGDLKQVDSLDQVVLVKGYYFRDEAETHDQLTTLALSRIQNALSLLLIPESRTLREISLLEIHSDARSNPFEAVRFEKISLQDLVRYNGDTLEICFPLKDSLTLPKVCEEKLSAWYTPEQAQRDRKIFITGTADGTGIVEPMDLAYERALYVKNLIVREGAKEEKIQLSTGQRSNPLTLRNRCVIVYFE